MPNVLLPRPPTQPFRYLPPRFVLRGSDVCPAGPNSLTAFANDTGIGSVAWTNVTDAIASDDADATITLAATQTSNYLKATGPNFSLPVGEAIAGILVEVECAQSLVISQDMSARVVKGGTIQTAQTKTFEVPSADAYISFGGPTDLWGQSWTANDINAADFGVALYLDNALADNYQIDHIRITVYCGGVRRKFRTLLNVGY